jgi:stearoyl-CoA desaturase (delta-9 desaturase)
MTIARYASHKIDWPITLFLVLVPIAALILSPIYYFFGSNWAQITLFAMIFAGLTNLSITAGYHRLFAHRSYEAASIVRLFFILVGASAFQGSVLKWSADHRRHHSKEDTEDDPYSINKGFWYAHMGWLFLKDATNRNPKAADLEKSWMIRIQHRHYYAIAFLMGFGLPTLVGAFLGSAWGGFIIGGVLRVALTQQSTFFINSLCHYLGRRPYSLDVTARDSLVMAVLTHGEGYHNFHHKFQLDYRNGFRWYHWDPTKWTIRALALVGLACKLRQVSEKEILRARLQIDELKLKSKGYSEDVVQQLREKVLSAQASWKSRKDDYHQLKKDFDASSQARIAQLKIELKLKRLEFHYALKMWEMHLQAPQMVRI